MSSPLAAAAAPPRSKSSTGSRRAFTLPSRIRRPEPSTSTGSADGIETLFTSSSTKIVSFTTTNPSRPASSSRWQEAPSSETSEIISYHSAAERTLAVGVLRIYRVTSSNVSFLNSGNLLHTIFPKSQCWCVDGESKFVLRIRQDSYYRIEIPYETDEDKEKAEEFKQVLSQVLQYEKTPCPFRTGSEVAPLERPKTPPVPRQRTVKPPEKAKKWTFDKTWKTEVAARPSTPTRGSGPTPISTPEESRRGSTATNEEASGSPATRPQPVTPKVTPATPGRSPSVAERARAFQGMRSATAPLRPGIIGRWPSAQQATSRLSALQYPGSPMGSPMEKDDVDSFETAPCTPSSPTPNFVDAVAELVNPWADEHKLQRAQEEERGRHRHRRQISNITVRPRSLELAVEAALRTPTTAVGDPSSPPSTPPLVSDSEEDTLATPFSDISTPPGNAIRMKRLTGATQRRAFSPMPHPQNLFRPPNRTVGKNFTTALVRRTYELILGPPAHIVTLMLNIAARISLGAFSWQSYRVRHTAEKKIPCAWESSDEEEWSEDDYGIPLSNLDGSGSSFGRRAFSGEVD